LNGFSHFIHQPPADNPLAFTVFWRHRRIALAAFFSRSAVGGLLLLFGHFVHLRLTLLVRSCTTSWRSPDDVTGHHRACAVRCVL